MANIFRKFKESSIEVKASIAYMFCSVIQRSLSFITMPLFTRLLTTTQYGQYTIYSSWVSIFSIFLTLNLAYGTFSPAMMKFKDDREGYIASVQGICTVLSAVFLAIYLPFRNTFNVLLEMPTFLVVAMVLEIIFTCSFSCWCGKKRFEYKYISVIVITLLIAFASPLVAFVLVQCFEEKGYARIIGYALVASIVGVVFYVLNFVKGKNFFNKEYWKYALTFNIPLIIYYLSQVVFNQSDRLMINYLCGTDKAGIYGVAYNLAMILSFIISSISSAYMPWLYNKIKQKEHKANQKVSLYIAILMAVLISFIIWLAPEIILIMAGEAYMEAIWIVPPVAASLLLLLYTDFSTNIEFYYKKRVGLIIASVFAAVLNIVLNAIFIPKFGFIAAGYTTLLSYIVFAVSNYLVILRYVRKGRELYGIYNIKLLLLVFLVFMIVNACAMLLYDFMIARICIMAATAIVLFAFRKKIIKYFKQLLSKEERKEEEQKEEQKEEVEQPKNE